MSKSESATTVDNTYYNCIPCDYTARTEQAIGLCPRCGDSLSPTLSIE